MKKAYPNTDLSTNLCANPSCRKPLKKRLEHLDFCYSCIKAKKQSKKNYSCYNKIKNIIPVYNKIKNIPTVKKTVTMQSTLRL